MLSDVMPRLNPRILDADKETNAGGRSKFLDFTDKQRKNIDYLYLFYFHTGQTVKTVTDFEQLSESQMNQYMLQTLKYLRRSSKLLLLNKNK
jgi:hypothetical protein